MGRQSQTISLNYSHHDCNACLPTLIGRSRQNKENYWIDTDSDNQLITREIPADLGTRGASFDWCRKSTSFLLPKLTVNWLILTGFNSNEIE